MKIIDTFGQSPFQLSITQFACLENSQSVGVNESILTIMKHIKTQMNLIFSVNEQQRG